MPHLAAAAINAWLNEQRNTVINQSILDGTQRAIISPALTADAQGMFYSAILTVVEALKGISMGQFSWATVKLYYTAFYSVRALLAMNDVAIFYPSNGKPHSLRIVVGEVARRESGVTHKVVWNVMKAQLSASPLLDKIGLQPAHEWLTKLREEVNYRNPRFLDPSLPPHFNAMDRLGISAAIVAYITDKSYLYAFDEDHAAVAFPIECLRSAGVALQRSRIQLNASDTAHIQKCLAGTNIDPSIFLEIAK